MRELGHRALFDADASDDLATVDLGGAAERRAVRGAFAGHRRADRRFAAGDAEVLAVELVPARLAAVAGARRTAIDVAQVVDHAELRPLPAGGAARAFLRLLKVDVDLGAVLSLGRERRGREQTARDPRHSLPPRCEKFRPKTPSAMRFLRISTEPPAIIQPRQRRRQYSTRLSWL